MLFSSEGSYFLHLSQVTLCCMASPCQFRALYRTHLHLCINICKCIYYYACMFNMHMCMQCICVGVLYLLLMIDESSLYRLKTCEILMVCGHTLQRFRVNTFYDLCQAVLSYTVGIQPNLLQVFMFIITWSLFLLN